MERSPLKSKWAEVFYRFHQGMILRKQILRKLFDKKLENDILVPMGKHYVSCLVSTIGVFYLTRKERLAFKFVASAVTFSTFFIYITFSYEENLFYFKGLEDTKTGEIIRENYLASHPSSWLCKDFSIKQNQYQTYHTKYHYRENPMEKFGEYITEIKIQK